MELKFLELTQENMLVTEHEAKFIELLKFIPHQVTTDEKKARSFQSGLKPWIQNRVVLEITNYATLVHKVVSLSQVVSCLTKRKSIRRGNSRRIINILKRNLGIIVQRSLCEVRDVESREYR